MSLKVQHSPEGQTQSPEKTRLPPRQCLLLGGSGEDGFTVVTWFRDSLGRVIWAAEPAANKLSSSTWLEAAFTQAQVALVHPRIFSDVWHIARRAEALHVQLSMPSSSFQGRGQV